MPAIAFSAKFTPILLLLASNLFMTFAWYGHLRFKEVPLAGVILASWAIAFIEYCLAVPANRYGHAVYSAAELMTIQEVVTLRGPCRLLGPTTSRSRSAGTMPPALH
jgi:uncharacterized protein